MRIEYCKYIKKFDIHNINYSGIIDLEEGISRIKNLEKYFNEYNGSAIIKILLNTTGYINTSPETHNKLAKIARETFNKGFKIKLAVLNSKYNSILSDNEAWFTKESLAIEWLKGE